MAEKEATGHVLSAHIQSPHPYTITLNFSARLHPMHRVLPPNPIGRERGLNPFPLSLAGDSGLVTVAPESHFPGPILHPTVLVLSLLFIDRSNNTDFHSTEALSLPSSPEN